MYDYNSLKNDLIQSGISPNDTIIIHSSMKSIGQVAGGADTVLDVFMDYWGPKGLVVFPTLSHNLVNKQNPIFDVKQTPSVVGLLSEMFRKRHGVVRSLHPTHSVAAFGVESVEFISDHENFDTPCAKASPWGKLLDRKAKILFIGTGIKCNTFLHGVEEWSKVPNMLTEETQPLKVIDSEGNCINVASKRHVGNHSKYYGKMKEPFIDNKIMKVIKFGDAECWLMDCLKAKALVSKTLKLNPQFFTEETF